MTETVAGSELYPPKRPLFGRAVLRRAAIPFLLTLLTLAICASVVIGPSDVTFPDVLALLDASLRGDPAGDGLRNAVIVYDIRLPRTLLGCLVGAGLAVSGAMMQGLFRNPLADPGLIGVSSGAALAAVAAIVLAGSFSLVIPSSLRPHLLPVAAFAGGLLTTILLYAVATRSAQTSITAMLLAGIALGALSGAFTGFMIFRSTDDQLRDFTFWSMGSLGGATWREVIAILPFIALLFAALPFVGNGLNALLLGETDAYHLGFDPQRLKRWIIVLTAAATGSAVAAAGAIGFVGIVVPHMLRMAIGPDHRLLLPACALLGAALLVGADILSRTIVAPAELPIGIVTAIIGAPVFLSILLRRRAVFDF
ncbi:iron ABC transporter permease [Stappia sp. F7233]|uniref:Iron ABC transporter permease n=1 Tax=Stappia albiluteola TaxID=2758565 RepID=A0A839AAW9_9HYPH|nr:iron ABC transporter permease [Stappia albiluteola]MBA5776174.1 iron ABC transporter permease [Stappia albiluteola]